MSKAKKFLLALVASAFVAFVGCGLLVGPCAKAWWRYGVLVHTCPAGVMPYLSVEGSALGRGVTGTVRVSASARVYGAELDPIDTVDVRRFSPSVVVVDDAGKEHEVEVLHTWYGSGWDWSGTGAQVARVQLPSTLPDGDYLLRARASTPSGELVVDAPLALYRPALEHVLTDAPLYKPGQVVRARAVLLAADSLAPTEGRPGRWQVFDPAGEMVYEEKGRTGPMGVTDFSFPLADDAEVGTWRVGFRSGAVDTTREVRVAPFKLPRFTVELTPDRPWYGKNAAITLSGVARYTSGAPVQAAPVRLTLGVWGEWPPPTSWPAEVALTTDGEGRFTYPLGQVPEDLVGTAQLHVMAAVTEAAGESAAGTATLLLSEDALAVEAVTELAGGLVPDANNRLYLRVTTPHGEVLPGAKLHLRREWDTRDPGLDATADADGVARFQLDPGAAVTVTEPALPVRPVAPPPPVEVSGLADAVTGAAGTMELRALADALQAAWAPCAARGGAGGEVYLRVAGGRVATVWSTFAPGLERCLAARAEGTAVRGGSDRLVRLDVQLADPGTAALQADVRTLQGVVPGVDDAVQDVLADARACAAGHTGGALPDAWVWELSPGETRLRFTRVADDEGDEEGAGVAACVGRALPRVALYEPHAGGPAMGMLRVHVQAGVSEQTTRTSPASWPGFAFVVTAEGVGDTVLRMPLGEVPPLRLRFSEVVVDPGDELELTALRSAAYTGTLPEELRLVQGDRLLAKIAFDPEAKLGRFVVPAGTSGFASVEYGGARAVLYVRPEETLQLELTAAGDWRPGAAAGLRVKTTGRRGPVAAGVSLAGVDQAMASLAPLPGPADWASTTVLASSAQPAFGVLDAQALQTGQISGEQALQAAVLRISTLPPTQPGGDSVYASAATEPDIETPLAASFWPLYAEVRKAVRSWEASAGEADVLKAERMAQLWADTLHAHPATDPFGRPLRLEYLPHDLLVLTDPRVMVADARHLPEDQENWTLYVDTELR